MTVPATPRPVPIDLHPAPNRALVATFRRRLMRSAILAGSSVLALSTAQGVAALLGGE